MKRTVNVITIGTFGASSKIRYFKKEEFKSDFAPVNAKIEEVKFNKEQLIKMTYDV